MSESSAIDTHYKGYRFRSRLEARWAIFFDGIQLPYLYEPEGFDLNGIKYLPDFYLRDGIKLYGEDNSYSKVWVEIKPSVELDSEDRQKVARFVQQTENTILLISGDPEPGATMRLIAHRANGGAWSTRRVKWIELGGAEIGLLDLAALSQLNDPATTSALELLTETPTLMMAYTAAREARFEHGEAPHSQSFKYERPCDSCGKLFIPRQEHHRLCYSCYLAERTAVTPVSVAPSETVSTVPKVRKNPYRLRVLLAVLALLVLCAVVIVAVVRSKQVNATQDVATPTATEQPFLVSEPTTLPRAGVNDLEPVSSCSCEQNLYDCGDFETHAQAQACFDACYVQSGDIHFLDSNSDGEACERLP